MFEKCPVITSDIKNKRICVKLKLRNNVVCIIFKMFIETNYISKEWMYGVPNTTFSTQPLDCGINKFFKALYYKKSNAWKN